MRPAHLALVPALLLGSALGAEQPAQPAFAKKPTATRAGDRVRIEFSVDRETDVAVYIENSRGEIVRHLAAGLLGPKAPAPLKAGTAQSLEWDGLDDDGKKAVGGPFKVRVGLNLNGSWGGTAFCEKDQAGPNHISCAIGLGTGADGRVYVMDDRSGWLYWPAKAVHVFRRDGSYERTIKPFPSNTPPERLKAAGAFRNDRGHLNPLIHRVQSMSFYPYEDERTRQIAVTPAGQVVLPVVPTQSAGRGDSRGFAAHLAAIDADGGIPFDHYAGPALGKINWFGERWYEDQGPCLQSAADGKCVYLVGVGQRVYEKYYKLRKHHVVYRAPLPTLGPAEVFFGEVDKPAADEKHLNDPRGLAVDGKGHLFVADFGNNRVVVLKEADAGYVGALSVEAPEWVGVDPVTGVVYVHSKERLLKFASWKDTKERTALPLGRAYAGLSGWRKDRQRLSFAVDGSARPPVIWMGQTMGALPLQRCEDRGDRFTDFQPAGCFPSPRHERPASDPTHRMVLCGNQLLDEATGKIRKVATQPQAVGNGQGSLARLDREGNLYLSQAAGGIWKCDTSGKRVPFPATANDPKLKGHIPGGSTGTTAWERDHYVDRKGDIYAKVRGTAYHGLMHVDVFGPDGAKKRTVLWGVTDGAYGPRVDPQGNVYMMECVKPAGQPFPAAFAARVTDRWVKHWYDWIYGSIVKFPPAGGNLWLKVRDPAKNRPEAEPVKLPDSLPKVKVCSTFRGDENQMQGHLWMAPGVAHVGDMGMGGGGEHCHCTGCDFDVDDFGRSFAPDNGRQRLTVFDTAGNVITHIGAYGNQDCCGPESYVLDPKEKFYRPRRPDDPKDMKSPFAEPEVAFNWIVGLAVTDRHAYVADCANRRMLRVKLDYAAAETVSLP